METQIERPQKRKDVHQDEQYHRWHDECHLQLVITHPTRETVDLHIRFGIVRNKMWYLGREILYC